MLYKLARNQLEHRAFKMWKRSKSIAHNKRNKDNTMREMHNKETMKMTKKKERANPNDLGNLHTQNHLHCQPCFHTKNERCYAIDSWQKQKDIIHCTSCFRQNDASHGVIRLEIYPMVKKWQLARFGPVVTITVVELYPFSWPDTGQIPLVTCQL
jgi:hypothetical protein